MILGKNIPFKYRWLGTAALVATALAAISVIIFSATTSARHDIDELAFVNADQRLWEIVEVEEHVIEFQRELWRAQALADGDMSRIRDSFDELVEITTKVRTSPEFQELFELPSINATLSEVERGIAIIQTSFSDEDSILSLQIPLLQQTSEWMLSNASALCNSSLPAFTELATLHRDSVANSLFELGFIIVLMFWILFVSVVVLLFSLRSGAKRTSEISATRNRLNAMVSTSLDGILVADREGRIVDFNGAARRIFGYSLDEAIGKDLADLIIPDHLKSAHKNGMRRYLATREKRVIDQGLVQLEAQDKFGRVFPVELSISSAESEDGEIFVSFIRDISERVAAEAELVEARDSAVEGEKAKANLLAVMSHEIRTPLNGLLGSLQLLGGTRLNERQRNFVDVMNTSGQMLLEHVNNVLDISRVDSGKVERTEQHFDVMEMVGEVVSSLEAQANGRGNKLSVESLGAGVAGVRGDKARLTQILVNLVGNALKFTENGQVIVEVERDGDQDTIEFRVIDTGIGITEKNLKKIFEDFVTLDTSFRREVEGTGLGLGIVKRLVALLGGEIGVESVVDEGSVFWIRVPLPPSELDTNRKAKVTTHEDPRPSSSRSVLLVEDNEINRLVAREMLSSFGCVTTEAGDGQEGVELAEEQKFDLILCDISMPRMDGIEATKTIRAGKGPNANVPIIALTAHALPDDIARFQAAGMNDVVVKPLTFDEMKRVLAENLGELKNSAQGNSVTDELVSVLGKERAQDVITQANDEIATGLTKLQAMVVDGAKSIQLRDVAHKLSGVAAVVGYSDLHAKLSDLEEAAFDRPTSELETLVAEAKAILESKLLG